MADLKWSDVDLERGEIRFYRRKVAKTQTMGLSTMLQSLLRLYMDILPHLGQDGKLLYAVTRGDKVGTNGLSAANISMIVKRFGQGISTHAYFLHIFWLLFPHQIHSRYRTHRENTFYAPLST